MKNNIGRPSLLRVHGITIYDLEKAYQQLGSYNAVAKEFSTTKTTVMKYIGKKGKRKRGRKKGYCISKTRFFLEENPELLLGSTQDAIMAAKKEHLSASYMRTLVAEKKLLVRNAIIREVKLIMRNNVAVRDTRGRFIPTAAIKYVWIPRWDWDKPVFVRVILKDRSKAKIPTMFTPTLSIIAPSASEDQSQETRTP
jgi:hypothetical protein